MVDGVQHPVIWTHGKVFDAGVPSGFVSAEFTAVDEGFMAGTAESKTATVPFRWSPQFGFQMLPTSGNAINVNSSAPCLSMTITSTRSRGLTANADGIVLSFLVRLTPGEASWRSEPRTPSHSNRRQRVGNARSSLEVTAP